MCGIAGFTFNNQRKLKSALKIMVHRGPDDSGCYFDDNISLGHQRLSILDLSSTGKQPMASVDGGIIIAFNGEIYNFQELKKELMKRGYKFVSQSDTEVIIYGYQEYGVSFFSQMRGMWALTIYDKEKQKVILARDYFGIKPLCYAIANKKLYFASEMKSMASMLSALRPNTDFYYQYFNLGYFIPPETCYSGVKKLLPGEILIWDLAGKKIEFKQTELINRDEMSCANNFEEAVELVNQTLLDSVKAHYVSDVPVGLLLSGGNDSSLLAAMSVACGQKPVAYNLNIKGSIDNGYAVKISRHLGLELVSEEMTEKRLAEQYEKIWEIVDEPTSDSSIIPTSLIYSFIAGRAKAVLSGEGGDEMFGGYLRHLRLARPNHVKERSFIVNMFNIFGRGNSRFSLKYINPALNRFRNLVLDQTQNDVISIYLTSTKKIDFPFYYRDISKDLYNYWQNFNQKARGRNNLFFDRFLYLPNDLMYKADMSSMAYSIESRVPFLDKIMYNIVIKGIPAKFQLSSEYTQKLILKKVMEKYLPKELIYRPKKGFSFSFKKYCFKFFVDDYSQAAEFHLKNKDIFSLANSGLEKIINKRYNELIVNKYPGFAFSLITNWRVMG